MSSISNDPIEQAEIERDPKGVLFDTAISLAQFRMNTSLPGSRYSRIQDMLTYELITEQYRHSSDLMDCQPGVILESIFFLNMRQLPIPISASTGIEDMRGVDFYLFGKPIDVTSNPDPKILNEKLSNKSSTVICLPRYMYQRSAKQYRGENHIINAFLRNDLPPIEYLKMLIMVNSDFKNILTENLTRRYRNTGNYRFKGITEKDISNIHNLIVNLSSALK